MSDPTPDTDRVLRRALAAETDGVDATPDLLDRIRVAATDRAGGRRRRTLIAVAALAAVAGLATLFVADRDDPQRIDVVNDPTTTPSTPPNVQGLLTAAFPCDPGEAIQIAVYLEPAVTAEEVNALRDHLTRDERVATVRYVDQDETLDRFQRLFADEPELLATVTADVLPPAFLLGLTDPARELEVRDRLEGTAGVYDVTEARCEAADPPETASPPPPTDRPSLVALVREDGWLVTMDLGTGEQRELHFVGDPNASDNDEEDGPSYIDAVEVSPDGAWIYFSTCCEPAFGATFRIPAAGGEPREVAHGRYPRVSPDGRLVATAGGPLLEVTAVDGTGLPLAQYDTGGDPAHLTWSPDGTRIAYVRSDGGVEGPTEVLLLGWDGAVLTPVDPGKPENPGSFASWTPDGTLVVSSGGPIEGERGLAQDPSYGWLLWVDEAGVVREQAGHQSSARTPVAGLPEALAADW